MSLPEVTFCICTYKRPWYACITLTALRDKVGYGGPKRFLVADGGSGPEDIAAYHAILHDHPHDIVVTSNLSDMLNSCARHSGEVWFVTLDDFLPRKFDITPDVNFLMQNPDVGAIRMGRLAFWESSKADQQIWAQMRPLGGLHWWVFDKARTTHPYICAINTTLYHRRFWDAYGDIDAAPPNMPGNAEPAAADRYNRKKGPTIAVPMRFGEDCLEWQEPVWHFGIWRSDEYAAPRPQGHFG